MAPASRPRESASSACSTTPFTIPATTPSIRRSKPGTARNAFCWLSTRPNNWHRSKIYQETGCELRSLLAGLLPGLVQMVVILGATTVLGAGIGGALGALAGGVGAAPGAVAGGELGLDVGMAILSWLGLAFLAGSIVKGLGRMAGEVKTGIHMAWFAPKVTPASMQDFQINEAARHLAHAVGILVRLILEGIVAYLLKRGAVGSTRAAMGTAQAIRSQGAGAVGEATMAELTAQLRSSRLGPAFADWVEKNWDNLKKNPKLQEPVDTPAVKVSGSPAKATSAPVKRVPPTNKLKAVQNGSPHNIDGTTIKSDDFQAVRPGLDMTDLSAQDKLAKEALRKQGWPENKVEEIMNTGDNFQTRQFKAGDSLYGFDSSDYAGKDAQSAYWLDQDGFNDVQSRFYDADTDAWDRQGVKDYLALPCFNRADTICNGVVNTDNTGLSSTIGQATENITYTSPDSTVIQGSGSMSGGGTQVTPAPGTVSPAGGN